MAICGREVVGLVVYEMHEPVLDPTGEVLLMLYCFSLFIIVCKKMIEAQNTVLDMWDRCV